MHEILDSDIAQAGGYTVTAGSVLLIVVEWLGKYDFHDLTQGCMALGGAIFLFYKIVNIRLDAKLKKRMLSEDHECKCSKCKNEGSDDEL